MRRRSRLQGGRTRVLARSASRGPRVRTALLALLRVHRSISAAPPFVHPTDIGAYCGTSMQSAGGAKKISLRHARRPKLPKVQYGLRYAVGIVFDVFVQYRGLVFGFAKRQLLRQMRQRRGRVRICRLRRLDLEEEGQERLHWQRSCRHYEAKAKWEYEGFTCESERCYWRP